MGARQRRPESVRAMVNLAQPAKISLAQTKCGIRLFDACAALYHHDSWGSSQTNQVLRASGTGRGSRRGLFRDGSSAGLSSEDPQFWTTFLWDTMRGPMVDLMMWFRLRELLRDFAHEPSVTRLSVMFTCLPGSNDMLDNSTVSLRSSSISWRLM